MIEEANCKEASVRRWARDWSLVAAQPSVQGKFSGYGLEDLEDSVNDLAGRSAILLYSWSILTQIKHEVHLPWIGEVFNTTQWESGWPCSIPPT